MKAIGADPRVNDREVWGPKPYWVFFWTPDGGRSDEWRLTEVRDVHEALAWAEANARGRVIELFVEAEPGYIVQLVGERPGQD